MSRLRENLFDDWVYADEEEIEEFGSTEEEFNSNPEAKAVMREIDMLVRKIAV